MSEIKKIYQSIPRTIVIGCLLALFVSVASFKTSYGFWIFSMIVLGGLFIVAQALKIIVALPGKLPMLPCLLGILLTITGVLCDVSITVVQAFDVKLQAKTLIRFFFDLGFSLKQVHYLSFFGQILVVFETSVLWVAFLKVCPLILQGVRGVKLGPLNSVFVVSAIAPMLMAFSVYRCYLGLEWLVSKSLF